jgi:hypothetical protein
MGPIYDYYKLGKVPLLISRHNVLCRLIGIMKPSKGQIPTEDGGSAPHTDICLREKTLELFSRYVECNDE